MLSPELQERRRLEGDDRALEQADVLRLRGGLIKPVMKALSTVPFLTRLWIAMVLIINTVAQLELIPAELLALDAVALVKGLQIWRWLTAVSYIGGLNAQILQKGANLVQFGAALERQVGFGEFARVFTSCAMMLGIVCNVLGMPYIAEGLIMALTVLACQQDPEQQVRMYGVTFPQAALPFAQLILTYIFTQKTPVQDIIGMIVGFIHYSINDNMKPDGVFSQKRMGASRRGSDGSDGGSKKKGKEKKKPRIATLADLPPTSG
jgi:membrane associated rhomboid family serine protease